MTKCTFITYKTNASLSLLLNCSKLVCVCFFFARYILLFIIFHTHTRALYLIPVQKNKKLSGWQKDISLPAPLDFCIFIYKFIFCCHLVFFLFFSLTTHSRKRMMMMMMTRTMDRHGKINIKYVYSLK